jgi:hypothetical protein
MKRVNVPKLKLKRKNKDKEATWPLNIIALSISLP